ncbi:MAG: hypothetical protein JWP48_4993 [Actinoallomurus sp.]|nr:hypothetical protein [Actinoallomurus sp.]
MTDRGIDRIGVRWNPGEEQVGGPGLACQDTRDRAAVGGRAGDPAVGEGLTAAQLAGDRGQIGDHRDGVDPYAGGCPVDGGRGVQRIGDLGKDQQQPIMSAGRAGQEARQVLAERAADAVGDRYGDLLAVVGARQQVAAVPVASDGDAECPRACAQQIGQIGGHAGGDGDMKVVHRLYLSLGYQLDLRTPGS